MRLTQLFSREFYNIVLEFCIQKVYRCLTKTSSFFCFSSQKEIPCLNEDFTLPFLCSSIYLDPPPLPLPLPCQVFRYRLAPSSLAIPSARSTIEYKCEKAEGCEQSVIKLFKTPPLFNQNKSRKSVTIHTFDANNISARSYVCHVRLHCLQPGCNIP